MPARNAQVAGGSRIEFRIGINVGDIVVEDGDIFGDGVNVAARLEGLAEPGGVCVSGRVQEDCSGRLDISFHELGEQSLKNIARPIRVYKATVASEQVHPKAGDQTQLSALQLSIVVLPFANLTKDPEQ